MQAIPAIMEKRIAPPTISFKDPPTNSPAIPATAIIITDITVLNFFIQSQSSIKLQFFACSAPQRIGFASFRSELIVQCVDQMKTIRVVIVLRKIIQGIADDLQGRITTMSRASAIRTARTAVTGAQNAGRMDSYKAAEGMGIKLKKQWLAALDNRTRHAHAMLDGQTVDTDKPFKVDSYELMYPGDRSAPGYLVYNCRCTTIAVLPDVDTSDAQRWSIDPETGERKLVSDMSYREWQQGKSELSAELKSIVPQSSDVRDALDKITVRGTTPIKQGFSAFSKEDPLYKNIKNVLPDGNKFDVAMHGSPTSIAFGGRQANMSPRLLAQIIKHNPAYKGEDIRLIACNTGTKLDDSYCFAEELANALNVAVYAPNDLIFITKNGNIYIGEDRKGVFLEYTPNQRRRAK